MMWPPDPSCASRLTSFTVTAWPLRLTASTWITGNVDPSGGNWNPGATEIFDLGPAVAIPGNDLPAEPSGAD